MQAEFDPTNATPATHVEEAQSLQQLIQALTARQEEVRRQLAEAHDELSHLQEAQALDNAQVGSAFAAKWTRLLDSIGAHGNPDHYNELFAELREVGGPGMPVVNSGGIRVDNRQIVLNLCVPREEEPFQRLYLWLLGLLPILVNEANPNVLEQAALLRVFSDECEDRHELHLVAHPHHRRYEIQLRTRSEEVLIFKGNSLREALEYLRERYPYR